jgi:PTS system sucrose-specific IIC component
MNRKHDSKTTNLESSLVGHVYVQGTDVFDEAANKPPIERWTSSLLRIVQPLLPVLIAAGLISAVSTIISTMLTAGWVAGGVWEQILITLTVVGGAVLSFLPIFIGIFSAIQFAGSPAIGGMIGAVTLLPGLEASGIGTNCSAGNTCISNVFNGHALQPGLMGIAGVLFIVWLAAKLERLLRRVVPLRFQFLAIPLSTVGAVAFFSLYIFMPLGGLITNALIYPITSLLSLRGPLDGVVFGALYLPLYLFGFHYAHAPFTALLLPMMAVAGIAQVGAASAVWLKFHKRSASIRQIKGAVVTGIFGITQPVLLGVTLPLVKPFLAGMAGGAIGGGVVGLINSLTQQGVVAGAEGPLGITLAPLIKYGHWWLYLIALAIAFGTAFGATLWFGMPSAAQIDDDALSQSPDSHATQLDNVAAAL